MSDDSTRLELDRRSLLQRASATSSLALVGTAGVAARDHDRHDRSADETVLTELAVETDGHPAVERASVTFLRRGRQNVVRGEIEASHEIDASETRSDADLTKVSHSLSLEPDSIRPDSDETTWSDAIIADLGSDAVALERDVDTVDPAERFDGTDRDQTGQVSTQGLDEPAFEHLGDAVTAVETSSSECGPLCRTNLVVDIDRSDATDYSIADSTGRFETVDGSTCDGEEFGDRFPCAEIPSLYDCSIPDAFNTTWHTDDRDYDRTSAAADYYNTDFPVIPETRVSHSQSTSVSGTTLEVSGHWEHSGTLGFRTAIRYLLKGGVTAMYY
ncbi:hypothetical protein ACT4ML_09920 [Natrinema sp. LN54]|uniref:hypothetical protein n=1 Tax=Natrinema sp. LN54 TaxID=3458705 RepID=UPI004036A9BA